MSSKNSRTYEDRTGEATPPCGGKYHTTPNGEPNPSFMIYLQQTEGVSVEELRQYLVERIVPAWSEQDEVMRLRLHLLELYNESQKSPCVSHEGTQVKNYQAWIELILQDETVAKQLFSSETVQYIKSIYTFPIVARYTMVYDSKPTVVGLREYPAVQTIQQAGAENQLTPELLTALYGDVVCGWNKNIQTVRK